MDEVLPPPVPTQLIVFADDWGRHPSSSQHLIRELLPHYPTLWVNTVGTRRPSLSWSDIKRGIGKLWSYIDSDGSIEVEDTDYPDNLKVIDPLMYPGFRRAWQRRFNTRRISKAVTKHLIQGHRRVVITTLPVTADLIGKLYAQNWVYYCVDNYAQWPGSDSYVMEFMEWEMVPKVDAVACVSEVLQERALGMGAVEPSLLSHGADAAMWHTPATDSILSPNWPGDDKHIALFWGLIDERMDREWINALSNQQDCRVVFAGPLHDAWLFSTMSGVLFLGPLEHRSLPAHAASSQVLIMPYIDAPVTRAMQPLKLLEYLATMKPVIVRDLPSTRIWADCCDLAADAETFVELVAKRIKTGTPSEQIEARKRRLVNESWTAKAVQLAGLINSGSG
ncbi:MAG: glycosyltransferase [Planctomycetota bacterium]